MWFDDGKLQGEVEELRSEGVLVRVLRTGPKGAKLQPEKGLYFPDTDLGLAPLMPADLEALDFAVREVDMIGYSFVQRSDDVAQLQQEMAARRPDWQRLGLIAKVETRHGVRPWRRTNSGCCFDHLPGVVVLELGGAQIAEG